MNKKLFEDIDTRLLFGVKCSELNQIQQNYFERLKIQTQSAFNNKRYGWNLSHFLVGIHKKPFFKFIGLSINSLKMYTKNIF